VKALALSICLFPTAAFSQFPKGTLADYLAAHPIPGGLAVGAERAPGDGRSLAEFGYKTVRLGSVVAIVPVEQVEIARSVERFPRLEALQSPSTTVLRLVSTFTAPQWRLAGTQGIVLGDLQGEQRKIVVPLLSQPLRWKHYRLGPRNQGTKMLAEGGVAPSDMRRVRIKLSPRLSFLVPHTEAWGGYTVFDPAARVWKVGDEFWERNQDGSRSTWEMLGSEVRKRLPNAPKRGQLDTSALKTWVTIPLKTTVAEALGLIGAATGREIFADARVRAQYVSFPERRAKAGDLLDALTLSVTGSYRKLGSSYLLVADVEGAGTRRLRFLRDRYEMAQRLRAQTQAWQQAITLSGLARHALSGPDDAVHFTDHLSHRLTGTEPKEFFPVEELSRPQRAYLDRVLDSDTASKFRRDRVAVQSNLHFQFILPNGQALVSEDSFSPAAGPPPERPEPTLPLAAHPIGLVRPLVVALTTSTEAREAGEVARAFGFTELWVRTDRREPLAAAVAQGLPTRLFVRPWESAEPLEDPDGTLLRERPKRSEDLGGWPTPTHSPLSPRWPIVQARVKELAQTPGLMGIVLADTAPNGYEGLGNGRFVQSYPRLLNEMSAFGYDEAMRLAFFRAHGVDPIDLVVDGLDDGYTLYNPFFSHYPVDGPRDLQAVTTQWSLFRAQKNQAAIAALGRELPNLPILTDVRRSSPTQPPLLTLTLRPWNPREALPRYENSPVPAEPGDVIFLTANPAAYFMRTARSLGGKPNLALAIDLTRIPVRRWEEILAKAFVRK
jgi:hypothetical protein